MEPANRPRGLEATSDSMRNPPKALYNVEFILKSTEAERSRFIPALEEVIRYGLSAVNELLSKPERLDDAVLGSVSLYYQILEQTDAALVLLREACAIGMRGPLRSMLEGLLGLEYMLGPELGRRGRAYLVADIHQRIATYRRLDANTQPGREFFRELATDRFLGEVRECLQTDSSQVVGRLKQALARKSLGGVTEEYQRVKKQKKGGRPKWYELYGGPRNVEALARYLNAISTYELLYRKWSATAHGEDFERHLHAKTVGELRLRGLRSADDLPAICSLAVVFASRGTRTFIQYFFPEENFAAWYFRNIRPVMFDSDQKVE